MDVILHNQDHRGCCREAISRGRPLMSFLFVFSTVVVGEEVFALDLAARIDETASFICRDGWKCLVFPPPFGRGLTAEVSERRHEHA